MRIVVVKGKEGEVSCLRVTNSKDYYNKKYDVLTYVNKLWNPYHVKRIKEYYKPNC